MPKIITIANQKGGVAKTTTVINLASGLARLGKKILILDIDPQSNCSSGFGVYNAEKDTVYDILVNDAEPETCIRKTNFPYIDIIPSNQNLSGAEIELVNEISREMRLKNKLENMISDYDFIFIDTPPSLSLLTINAFTASHSVFIPIQCEYYALEGITQILKTIKLIKKNLNSKLYIEGVCLTMFSTTTNLAKEVEESVRTHFKEKTYKTVIPRNVSISEAPSHNLSVQDYAPKSKGAEAYNALADEFLKKQM